MLLKCVSQRDLATNKSASAHLQMHFSALFSLHNNKIIALVLEMAASPPLRSSEQPKTPFPEQSGVTSMPGGVVRLLGGARLGPSGEAGVPMGAQLCHGVSRVENTQWSSAEDPGALPAPITCF